MSIECSNRSNVATHVRGVMVLAFVPAWMCCGIVARADRNTSPDLSISAERFPGADAVILRWEQQWTLDADGTVRRRDHQWLKLFNRRPIRRVADPRIDFVHGRDEVTIHVARTHLPDGTIVPVPEYSFNVAAPNDVAGWPVYADWQQTVVSFSAIQPGAVLELDYEVVTPAGVLPWIEGDLRLRENYPIVSRTLSVTLPKGVALRHQVLGDAADSAKRRQLHTDDTVTYLWDFADLPGDPDEPQSLPWQRRSGRLRFSTCPSTQAWVRALVDRVEQAARVDDAIKKFALASVDGEVDPTERVDRLAQKLHDSFNFITSRRSFRSLECRDAAHVLRSNYGNPLESAALMLAAVRSLNMIASLAVGVERDLPCGTERLVLTQSSVAGMVVVIDLPGGAVRVHPEHGVFTNPGHWGRKLLLSLDEHDAMQVTRVFARGEDKPSELNISGKLAIGPDGKATGELRLRLTGAFFDPAKLAKAEAQEKLVESLVGRVLKDVDVSAHSVVRLSDEAFRATALVASKDALETAGGLRVLQLGDGPAFLSEIPLPLGRSYRRTDVALVGPCRERINITVELPEGVTASILPAALGPVTGDWGSVEQEIKADGRTVHFQRKIEINSEAIPASSFGTLREAINALRADQSLLLAWEK